MTLQPVQVNPRCRVGLFRSRSLSELHGRAERASLLGLGTRGSGQCGGAGLPPPSPRGAQPHVSPKVRSISHEDLSLTGVDWLPPSPRYASVVTHRNQVCEPCHKPNVWIVSSQLSLFLSQESLHCQTGDEDVLPSRTTLQVCVAPRTITGIGAPRFYAASQLQRDWRGRLSHCSCEVSWCFWGESLFPVCSSCQV